MSNVTSWRNWHFVSFLVWGWIVSCQNQTSADSNHMTISRAQMKDQSFSLHISWCNMSHQHKNENEMKLRFTGQGCQFKVIRTSQIKVNWQLSKWDMWRPLSDHQQRGLKYTTFRAINPPLQSRRLTLTVNSTFIWKFAILMKFNWQLSNYSIRWPSSPDRIAGSGISPLSSSFFEVIRWQVTTFQMIQAQVQFF